MCCYTGGFSLAAAVLGGAAEVTGVDSSEHALTLARANAELNAVTNAKFESGDVFDSLQQRVAEKQKYDAIVLDPPKFVRGKAGIEPALRAYHRINQLAVELLEPEGILVTCSCSGNVGREDFADMLFGVAQKTKRDIQILETRGASADHPTSVLCPETQYLKCFICRVK
jgi:23S rRNA (cytosine1962-C5)-methyltransferase